MANNRYRLSSDVYDREDDSAKIPPAKIIYLSVEGNVTEKEYFECLSKCRDSLGINSKITVEVLSRKDTNSAPKHVIELLEEYVELRNTDEKIEVSHLPEEFRKRHSVDEVERYLNDLMDKEESKVFSDELRLLGFDISYIKYLKDHVKEYDEFGIVIDRDKETHSERNMRDCINHCNSHNYLCFISNPCFEFWLLLHLCDVKEEFANSLGDISDNRKVSKHQTFVSNEVKKRAHHGKGNIDFENNYLPYVSIATERAKGFATTEEELVTKIGTNLYKLIEKMQNFQD